MALESIDERKRARFEFLALLYDKVNGRPYTTISREVIAREMDLNHQDTSDVIEWLQRERLIDRAGMAGVGITHEGVSEIEAAHNRPVVPTPVINVVNVRYMGYGAQVQQGTYNSSQVMGSAHTFDVARQDLETLHAQLDSRSSSDDMRREAEIHLATAKQQLEATYPIAIVVETCLGAARELINGLT